MRRSRRVGVLAVLLGAVVLLGTGGLAMWAVQGVQRVEAMRHRDVAERLFDAMEDELSTLVALEESRSFLEYRTFYVPDGAADDVVLRSPLADGPQTVAVKGYFQVDPDGTVQSPGDLLDNDVVLAQEQGWQPPEDNFARNAFVNEVVTKVSSWTESNPVVDVPKQALERLNSLGSQRRMERSVQNVPTQQSNVDVYQNKAREALPDDEQQFATQQAVVADGNGEPRQQEAVDGDGQAAGSTTLELAAVAVDAGNRTTGDATPRQAAGAIDVRVTPMVGQPVADGLLLHRTVHIGGEAYRQGMVVDPTLLGDMLEERVMEAAGLPEVQLSWDGHPPRGEWVFSHRFAPPFQDLSVQAGVMPIPGVVGLEASLLRGGVFALTLTVLAVGAALAIAVRTELQFAQRRSDFVAAVSHELRTPLTSIRMYAEMLRDGMVPDPERQRTYHATITAESERLSRLIGNVLELARLERGQERAEPVMGDVGPVIEEAVAMLAPHAAAQGVSVHVDVSPGLPAARIDRDALIQVLLNLIDNGVKFGGQGQVEVQARAQGGAVVVSVRDQGPGVPRGQLPLIFEAFYRGERELTRTTKGTGIGLALVAGLVQDMGGRVTARNHPDGGLEVVVKLVAG